MMLTLFYDGLCPLCSWEIEHYRQLLPADTTRFLDVSAPGFDAGGHGLDPLEVQRVLHVQAGDELRTGVDAFLTIYDAIPRYRWLARLGRLQLVHFCLRIGYAVIARLRPWLPRKTRACEAGSCQAPR